MAEAVDSDILNATAASTTDDQTPQPVAGDPTQSSRTIPAPFYKPYTVAQKFKSASRDTFGPFALLGVGVSAGFAQLTNTPSEWGQGAQGYGKRYGNAFGINLSYQYFSATLESVLHEDPRYFPSTDRSAKGRLKHAIAYTFLTRKDDGSSGVSYARWASAFGAGFLSNSWNPRSNSSAADAVQTAGAILGLNLAIKVGQEFVPFSAPSESLGSLRQAPCRKNESKNSRRMHAFETGRNPHRRR